jgi:hypothetical protein
VSRPQLSRIECLNEVVIATRNLCAWDRLLVAIDASDDLGLNPDDLDALHAAVDQMDLIATRLFRTLDGLLTA